jgi:hypothetical protein
MTSLIGTRRQTSEENDKDGLVRLHIHRKYWSEEIQDRVVVRQESFLLCHLQRSHIHWTCHYLLDQESRSVSPMTDRHLDLRAN